MKQMFSYSHDGFVLLLIELGVQLTKPARNLLAWLMVALLEKTKAHLFTLADRLPDDETTDRARQQRIRRFLSNPRITPQLFISALVGLAQPLLKDSAVIELVIDRTEWIKRQTPVNVLSVAISYKGRALPMFWVVYNRRGVSRMTDWQAVLSPVIEALRASCWAQNKTLHLLADREFASPKLSQWLWETYRVGSTLRLKKSEYLQTVEESVPVKHYFSQLAPGQCRFLRRHRVTRSCQFHLNIALWWGKGYNGPWALMTTNRNLLVTISAYSRRFGIEPMYKDWKTNAFDIEGTKVTQAKRISTLLIPIALCYVICVLEGDRQEATGEVIKAHKEKRTKGLFLVGLCAFCRKLRSLKLNRLLTFFNQLFSGWFWPEKLAQILQI